MHSNSIFLFFSSSRNLLPFPQLNYGLGASGLHLPGAGASQIKGPAPRVTPAQEGGVCTVEPSRGGRTPSARSVPSPGPLRLESRGHDGLVAVLPPLRDLGNRHPVCLLTWGPRASGTHRCTPRLETGGLQPIHPVPSSSHAWQHDSVGPCAPGDHSGQQVRAVTPGRPQIH